MSNKPKLQIKSHQYQKQRNNTASQYIKSNENNRIN